MTSIGVIGRAFTGVGPGESERNSTVEQPRLPERHSFAMGRYDDVARSSPATATRCDSGEEGVIEVVCSQK